MKNHIMNVLKGIAIGIANVIPGFSGGTMAVMVKIYDLFVYAFANFFNDFKNVIKKCWSLFVGIILGILIALVTIVKLLEVIPFITVMFFVGLIIGSIPTIYKEVVTGQAEVRQTFKVGKVGVIAGSYVTLGHIKQNAKVRLIRAGIVVYEGKHSSLKRFKDDVKEV